MRNKIILVRGYCSVGKKATVAEFERIQADHAVIITALRRKRYLPPGFNLNALMEGRYTKDLLEHWRAIEMDHMLVAEYADMVIDQGRDQIKVVEGNALTVQWFYESVRAIHKQHGQSVVDVEVLWKGKNNCVSLVIEGKEFPYDEGIERLKPESCLG
jgi:hypothetical protein